MSYLQVNNFQCVRGKVTLPLTGAWVADVVSEPDSQQGSFPTPGTSVTLTVGAQAFTGVVRRASSPFGTVLSRLVGGAGGLPTVLDAKAYGQTTVQAVLGELLSDCGEKLDVSSDQDVLSAPLAAWVRLATPGWMALNLLVRAVTGGTWRVLPNGRIWVGVDQYPPTALSDFELLDYEPQELRAHVYADNPVIFPGETFLGGRSTSVEHLVEPVEIKSRVLFADEQLASVEAV